MQSETEEETEKLDNKWLIDFVNTDKLYQDYYKDDNYYSNIHFIYINKNNEIEKIKQDFFYMSKPNYILRDEIIGILKKNSIDNKVRYTLLSILKFNITIDPTDIKHFLIKKDIGYYNNKFFTLIKNIDTIVFEKTINMFQDLNDIIIIFYEKNVNESDSSKPKNITKRIYLNPYSTHKKTIRKTI
jgi:hypothetical protein